MASKAKNNVSSERAEQDRSLDLTREEKIRRRAYEIYLERGGEPGHDLEHWLQAERELTADQSKAAGEWSCPRRGRILSTALDPSVVCKNASTRGERNPS